MQSDKPESQTESVLFEGIDAINQVENVTEKAPDGLVEDEEVSVSSLQEKIVYLEGLLHEEQLRSAAAEQNLRRRHQEELEGAHKFAGQKFATQILPVKDYLEMALQDQSGQFEALKMGVQLTLNELQKAFDNTKITDINPKEGDKLDPHQHQALQTMESDQYEPNTVLTVLKKGYALSDRVLRPAMVSVSKAPDLKGDETHS